MKNTKKEELLKALMVASKDKALLEAFLEDLLTPVELREVPTRWEIVRRLSKGEKHADIAHTLKIGIGTVTRGSIEMRDKNGGFAKVLKKMYK
jgi:Trp operon repressor